MARSVTGDEVFLVLWCVDGLRVTFPLELVVWFQMERK